MIDSTFLGLSTHYNVTLATGDEVEITQESSGNPLSSGHDGLPAGQGDMINVFTADGEHNILSGVKNDEVE